MPGPGGGGPGGGFGGPGGGFGGPGGGFGGPGGFGRPGGPGFGHGGPGFGPGGPRFGPGGPGFGPGPFGPGWGGPFFGGPVLGPCGMPWCWWPILLLILPYIILVSIGIALIQSLVDCGDESTGGETESTCVEYEVFYALGLALVLICLFCCCFLGPHDRDYGTPGERAPMMATEAPPPPAVVYAEAGSAPPGSKVAMATATVAVKDT